MRRVEHSHTAHVAQVVEHILGKDEVTGSSPVMGSSEQIARPPEIQSPERWRIIRGKSNGEGEI